jgi:hypothetical protein
MLTNTLRGRAKAVWATDKKRINSPEMTTFFTVLSPSYVFVGKADLGLIKCYTNQES